MNYFILFLAVLCIAVQFCINKIYQKNFVQSLKDIFFFSFVSGIVGVIFFGLLSYCLYGKLPQFSSFSFIMSIILSLVSTLSSFVGILIMKYGKISVYSTFMMLGGMILPYLYGIIFLFESISAARIGGLVILILALLCSVVNFTEKKENTLSKIYYILCVFIFLLNGAMSIISKTHSINISAVPAANFIVYSNLWLTIINGAVYFIFARCMKSSEKQKNAQEIKSNKPNKFYAILAVTAFAVISGLGFLFQLISAKNVPAVTLYPFVTGGTIILSATCARIFFKEKISPPALAGIIMSFCGTLLFLIN